MPVCKSRSMTALGHQETNSIRANFFCFTPLTGIGLSLSLTSYLGHIPTSTALFCQRLGDLASAVNEALHHWARRAVVPRDDSNRLTGYRQFDRQFLDEWM